MRTPESEEAFRNYGFWNEGTQQAFHDGHVAVGGIGGAGYLTSLELAHLGVQNFSIADPEDFERVNGNRVIGAHEETFGRNKAEVLRDEILKVNRDANVRIFPEGISPDNVDDFLEGADVVVDALELSMPELGTAVARQARKLGIFVVNAEYVAQGAQVTVFDPKSKTTFERFMGIPGGEKAPLEDVAKHTVAPDRFLSYIPRYADLGTLKALQEGAPTPSNMIGAGQAAQMAVAEVMKVLRTRAGERTLPPTVAPKVRWMDAYNGVAGHTKHPRLSFYRHLSVAALRNAMHRNEPASYSAAQRAAHGDA